MIKAIVYHTKTGYTEKYAQALSEKIDLPCYNMVYALGHLGKNDEVIFMGNIMNGAVRGYKKAHKHFKTRFVVGVGISYPSNEVKEDVQDKTEVFDEPFYLLRGGIDYNKINKFKGFFLRKIAEIGHAGREKGEDTQHDKETLDVMMNGGDFFNSDYLQPVVDWYNQEKANIS
jgi:hypothetical protein